MFLATWWRLKAHYSLSSTPSPAPEGNTWLFSSLNAPYVDRLVSLTQCLPAIFQLSAPRVFRAPSVKKPAVAEKKHFEKQRESRPVTVESWPSVWTMSCQSQSSVKAQERACYYKMSAVAALSCGNTAAGPPIRNLLTDHRPTGLQ